MSRSLNNLNSLIFISLICHPNHCTSVNQGPKIDPAVNYENFCGIRTESAQMDQSYHLFYTLFGINE